MSRTLGRAHDERLTSGAIGQDVGSKSQSALRSRVPSAECLATIETLNNSMKPRSLKIRSNLAHAYQDVLTAAAIDALEELAKFDADRKAVMAVRLERRAARGRNRQPITFLDPRATIPRTSITVEDARNGAFSGSQIPPDLRRQWIQGT